MKKQPIDDKKSPNRVRRGGDWDGNAWGMLFYRSASNAYKRYDYSGFRIVRSKDRKQ